MKRWNKYGPEHLYRPFNTFRVPACKALKMVTIGPRCEELKSGNLRHPVPEPYIKRLREPPFVYIEATGRDIPIFIKGTWHIPLPCFLHLRYRLAMLFSKRLKRLLVELMRPLPEVLPYIT